MPISRKTFEAGKFKNKREDVFTEHPVAVFLSKNPFKAYTVREITKGVKMKEDTVRSMLATLKKKKVILHKTPYFIWKDKKRR
jgi:hypothetical protein